MNLTLKQTLYIGKFVINFKILYMTTLINLTPHPITSINNSGDKTTYQPSGIVARVSQNIISNGIQLDGIDVSYSTFGDTQDLPNPKPNTYYIVSSLVLNANKHRCDLIAPRTDNTALRNELGHIIAVRGWLL